MKQTTYEKKIEKYAKQGITIRPEIDIKCYNCLKKHSMFYLDELVRCAGEGKIIEGKCPHCRMPTITNFANQLEKVRKFFPNIISEMES